MTRVEDGVHCTQGIHLGLILLDFSFFLHLSV